MNFINLNKLFWILVAAISAALPVVFIKWYIKDDLSQYWLVLPAFCYCVLIYAYLQLLDDFQISILYPILKILSIILVVFTGIVINGEYITIHNLLGIILGFISIILLYYENS